MAANREKKFRVLKNCGRFSALYPEPWPKCLSLRQAPSDRDAIPIDEAIRRYGRMDGKLHIKDAFAGVPSGGREHVFDVPAGATHVQVFHRLRT